MPRLTAVPAGTSSRSAASWVDRVDRIRRITAAAAYGGGGLTVLGAATFGLLVAEAKIARLRVGDALEVPPPADGVYGSGPGEPISLVMLGDSTAAGYGVDEPARTPGVLLASGLAAAADRPVRFTNVAWVGAQSRDLGTQVDRALMAAPQVATILVGANDVTGRVAPAESIRHLGRAVRRLRASGTEVVVGTCPDLGTVAPIALPLRWMARRWSRQLAAAQTVAAVEAGGRTVSLTDLLGEEFAAYPDEMFGPDRFHPSARGYAQAAAVVLPSVCAALGVWPDSTTRPDPRRGEAVLPIYLAAAKAAERPGTEVAGFHVAGSERGPRGRWTTLMRRRRQDLPTEGDVPSPPPRRRAAGAPPPAR